MLKVVRVAWGKSGCSAVLPGEGGEEREQQQEPHAGAAGVARVRRARWPPARPLWPPRPDLTRQVQPACANFPARPWPINRRAPPPLRGRRKCFLRAAARELARPLSVPQRQQQAVIRRRPSVRPLLLAFLTAFNTNRPVVSDTTHQQFAGLSTY